MGIKPNTIPNRKTSIIFICSKGKKKGNKSNDEEEEKSRSVENLKKDKKFRVGIFYISSNGKTKQIN